jgi:hypothetical protein
VFCAVTRANLFAQIENVGRVDKENRKLRAELERRDEHAKLARATAQSLTDEVRGVSRQSKIGRVDRPRQRACKHLSDRIPQGKQTCPRRRAIAARHARRLCAAAGTARSPFLDSRKSAASTARANVRASILVTGYRKVSKPARAVAPSLPDTLADCAPGALLSRDIPV